MVHGLPRCTVSHGEARDATVACGIISLYGSHCAYASSPPRQAMLSTLALTTGKHQAAPHPDSRVQAWPMSIFIKGC